jgi:hypothetical protein
MCSIADDIALIDPFQTEMCGINMVLFSQVCLASASDIHERMEKKRFVLILDKHILLYDFFFIFTQIIFKPSVDTHLLLAGMNERINVENKLIYKYYGELSTQFK